tara:strand:+ start:1441 stop:1689 length:249 start_codon:yes stop_codon:yes gene_type:complete
MIKVRCINDKKLPPGAEIKEGKEYNVRESFINSFDQRAYVLVGVRNLGRTKFGLPWQGYNAERFKEIEKIEKMEEEINYALN